MTALRLVFAGSPAAAVPTLRALAFGPHEVQYVITRPPAPVGRKRVLTPTPVAQEAAERGIPVREAVRLQELESDLLAGSVDLGVIVAYGALVREPLLSWPRLGWINLHFSLLPRWRGAAPVQHALMAGEHQTGATVFQLTPGLDDGDWYAQHREPVGPSDTAGAVLDRLSETGAALTSSVVDALAAGSAVAHPQVGAVTLAPKLERAHGRVDWTADAARILAQWRGVTPEPGAWTQTDGGLAVKLLQLGPDADSEREGTPGTLWTTDGRVFVGTGSGPLELVRVQPAGKQAMPAREWARGWGNSPPRFT